MIEDWSVSQETQGQYKKKPVVIEAVRISERNYHEVAFWCHGEITNNIEDETDAIGSIRPAIEIKTLEGRMVADVGDWVIRGVKGEFYPCKNDIFRETYEPQVYEARVITDAE